MARKANRTKKVPRPSEKSQRSVLPHGRGRLPNKIYQFSFRESCEFVNLAGPSFQGASSHLQPRAVLSALPHSITIAGDCKVGLYDEVFKNFSAFALARWWEKQV